MNKVILMGRLVRDPDIRYTQGAKPMCTAKYTLAVDRKYKQQDGQTADFINCVAFGKNAEFAEKYLRQGIKIVVSGRIQTGSYTNKDGVKVKTTDVILEEQNFAESKASQEAQQAPSAPQPQPVQQTMPQQPQQPVQPQQTYQQPPQQQQTYQQPQPAPAPQRQEEQPWMSIPDGLEESLPFI